MRTMIAIVCGSLLVLLAGCATTAMQEPRIERISPEELERYRLVTEWSDS